MKVLHETCRQYVARRLSEGWRIVKQEGFNVLLQSPEGLLRPVDLRNDVETLRPNAPGDETSLIFSTAGEHWAQVDEEVADDLTTYVANRWNTAYQRDLYNHPASSGSGLINFIKLYFRCKHTYTSYAKPSLKSDSTVTDGTEVALTSSWVTYSQQWNTNPADSQPWEWADIDALQVGVSLRAGSGTYWTYCTQVYVEVDYTSISAPTVTTQVCDEIQTTQLDGNGNITATGGENCHTRGFCYIEGDSGDPTTANDKVEDNGGGSYGTGAFSKTISGLTEGTSYRVRAYAINAAGTGYGATVTCRTHHDLSVSDGLELGDTPSTQVILNATLTDGFKGGDSPSTQAVLNAILTDGFKGGDAPSGSLTISKILTDGFKLGDALSIFIAKYLSLTDGIKLGDTPSTQAILNAILSDGFKLSDTPSTRAVLNALLSDGFKLGDALSIYLLVSLALSDGMKLGDSPSIYLTIGLSLTDGAKLGDALSTQAVLNATLTEGLDLGDTPSTQAILNAELSDGVKLGDVTIANLLMDLILSDGLTLGDVLAIRIYTQYLERRYVIEVRNSDGDLVALLKDVWQLNFEEATNEAPKISFNLPADDSKLDYITPANELWVRDMKTDTVIARTKLSRKEDTRS